MYELNRILLRNFGPVDARYEDVTLDFSGAGPEVETASLIPAAGHVTHRPAPANLIMLQNGGGKGVLLTGITCTTIPHRHQDVEALRNFTVSLAQPSHVVLEWADTRTGRLLVTAQILAPDREGKLHRRFYSFHPAAALDADRLPFHRDGHWLPFEDYCTELRDVQRRVDALELRIEDGQERWEKHQRTLGLQPDLFDVQRRMNAKESDAAAAFTTTTSDAFVDWLLRKATDDDQYAELGTAFHSYAQAHDQRAAWDRERQFALAMQRACGEVAGLHQRRQETTRAAEGAQQQLVQLTAAVQLRERQLSDAFTVHADAVTDTYREHEEAKRVAERAERRVHHVRHHASTLELGALRAKQRSAEQDKKETEAEKAGWEMVPAALRHAQAQDDHARAQEALSLAERTAAPYIMAVHQAAADLRAGYARAEAAALEKVRQLTEANRQTETGIEQWQRRRERLLQDTGAAQADLRALREQIDSFTTTLDRARRDRLVEPDEQAGDAAARAEAHTCHLGQLMDEAKQARQAARTGRDQAHQHLADVQRRALSDRAAADAALAQTDRLRQQATAVQSLPLCADLLEAEPDELRAADALELLHEHAAVLGEAAGRRIAHLETTLTRTRISLREDQDLLDVLDTSGGLHPASPAVRHLCDDLVAHGIAAWPGWRWMHDNVPANAHPGVIRAHPDLIGGIIVGGADGLDTARRHLEQTRPLPAAAVTVGTGERLLSPAATDNDRFVIEPSPALHDEDAAGRERGEVTARITAATRQLQVLDTRLAEARELERHLANWLDACAQMPVPDRLAQLNDLQTTAAASETAAQEARDAAERHDATLHEAEQAYEELVDRTGEAQRALHVLRQLAGAETEAAQAHNRIAVLTAQCQEWRTEADDLRAACKRAEAELLRRAQAIEAARQEADTHAESHRAVPAPPGGDATTEPGAPHEPLPVLKHRYEQALDELRAVQVGEDQQQRATRAEEHLLRCQREWNQVPGPIQALAQKFSADPRATDEVQRHAILRNLAGQLTDLDDRLNALRDKESELKVRTDHLQSAASAAPLTGEEAAAWTPTTLEDATALGARAARELEEARTTERGASERYNGARRSQANSSRDLAAFRSVLPRLESAAHGLDLPAEANPYPGTAEAAEAEARQAAEEYRTRHQAAHDADRALETGVSRLKEEAADVRFEGLDIPLRTQISALGGAKIPALAENWTQALGSRIAALTSDLHAMAKTREALASQLGAHVTDLLHRLDQASRFSAFPDGDAPWAGQKFLTIRYKKPDQQPLAAAMRETVDALAQNPRTRKLKGIDVVLRCLKEAVPRGFTAEVMKPNAARRITRVPVEKMGTTFSGGQELTGAILLYCALAALRTSPGPRSRTRNGGLLLLDNPIGRANAAYLVDLQFEMAAALGIQLIYTTGLSDEEVTARFPMCIPLRNDAEARAGLSLIRLDERIRHALVPAPRITPDDGAAAPSGYLHSARLYTKESSAQ
ncbi:hypothetical protein [Streptomyces bluensis]|uniref:hypothetical protein n=1 Tax=Streptomyces bluensis TaxID=33897 RepID=UPI001674A494|nr:hypothetical protein [Streptomyces bluensis]GGZ79447.1 hypothetical protein GCM10010344_53160 [Streptomyces bluensis]